MAEGVIMTEKGLALSECDVCGYEPHLAGEKLHVENIKIKGKDTGIRSLLCFLCFDDGWHVKNVTFGYIVYTRHENEIKKVKIR